MGLAASFYAPSSCQEHSLAHFPRGCFAPLELGVLKHTAPSSSYDPSQRLSRCEIVHESRVSDSSQSQGSHLEDRVEKASPKLQNLARLPSHPWPRRPASARRVTAHCAGEIRQDLDTAKSETDRASYHDRREVLPSGAAFCNTDKAQRSAGLPAGMPTRMRTRASHPTSLSTMQQLTPSLGIRRVGGVQMPQLCTTAS